MNNHAHLLIYAEDYKELSKFMHKLNCTYAQLCKGRCGRMHREFDPSHTNEYCMLNQIMFDLILENLTRINEFVQKWELSIAMEDPIFHYTEYTP